MRPNRSAFKFWLVDSPHRVFNWINLVIGIALAGSAALCMIAAGFAFYKWVPPANELAIARPLPANNLIVAMKPSPTVSAPTATKVAITATPSATPIPPYICTQSQGQVSEKSFNSPVAGGIVPYRLYLPPCYSQTNRRYPYAILLHGVGSDETEWTDGLGVNNVLDQGIATGKLPPMILVMPYGGELQYDNYFANGASFESFILSDLIPEIENNYCTLNTQAGRALAGISRGGFWVFEIGFRHPTVFGVLAGHSAYFDPDNAPPDNNPLDLAQTVTLDPQTAPHIWLDVAEDDVDTRAGLDEFTQTLRARAIGHEYTVYPIGEHDAAYWQSHLAEYLTFYGQDWPHDPMTLPLCK